MSNLKYNPETLIAESEKTRDEKVARIQDQLDREKTRSVEREREAFAKRTDDWVVRCRHMFVAMVDAIDEKTITPAALSSFSLPTPPKMFDGMTEWETRDAMRTIAAIKDRHNYNVTILNSLVRDSDGMVTLGIPYLRALGLVGQS